ncbi:ABC transporter permease [Streptomyces sp. NBC_00083]|uniref:ABC transporter permease n=1 Tax=Streptomyces sp. NBC_00083 TaxID=2975647 RepID=UPI002254AD75|nr:ABC transporter permease [Streptomyces sp. NBC_00083]MCX5384317.1 ABC transporter permease [Streptomyces sp. NBC_00083]
MSTLTRTPDPQDDTRTPRRRLRGLAWLMVRQHRAALIACAAAILIGVLWMIHERSVALDSLHAAGWPAKPVDTLAGDTRHRVDNAFADAARYLGYLPVLFGVFVGAPLLASDHEHGTARLVCTQSVTRLRWLLWKAGFALTLAVVTTGVLGGVFTWWWRSVRPAVSSTWLDGTVFDNSLPVLTALAVFTTCLGILVGVLVRRAVAAMVVTFFTSAAALLVADYVKPRLATPRRVAFPLNGEHPAVLAHAVQVDTWVGTASGKVYGWGTCVSDAAENACRARLGIVNSVWDYFGDDQMAAIQWTAAGLLLGAGALMMALAMWRARRQAL